MRDLLDALRFRDVALAALPPVNEDAERQVAAALAKPPEGYVVRKLARKEGR